MGRGGKVKAAFRFVWANLDAILVMGVAALVVALDILLPDLDPQIVSAATLALLGVTAFIMLRDRRHRGQLDALSQLASDAFSDLPYDILWQDNEWDLRDRSHTTVRMTQRLRFTRGNVSTLPHWSSGDGAITRCAAAWRRDSASGWIDADLIHELPTRNGARLLFSLGEEHARGDMLDWRVERDATDRFSSSHESVTHEAKTASDFPRRVRIVWPPGEPPTHVEMRLGDRPARRLSVRHDQGRAYIDETINQLAKDEAFVLSWNW
jgi:hypothetical protein